MLSLALVVPAGFLARAPESPLAAPLRNAAGGILYEVFWCLAFFLIRPRRRGAWTVAAVVLALTCALELLQMWHPPLLERVRATSLGQLLIGSSFDWRDFPSYAAGCAIAWAWMWLVGER
jgi:hypothetical protein